MKVFKQNEPKLGFLNINKSFHLTNVCSNILMWLVFFFTPENITGLSLRTHFPGCGVKQQTCCYFDWREWSFKWEIRWFQSDEAGLAFISFESNLKSDRKTGCINTKCLQECRTIAQIQKERAEPAQINVTRWWLFRGDSCGSKSNCCTFDLSLSLSDFQARNV